MTAELKPITGVRESVEDLSGSVTACGCGTGSASR